MCQFASDETGDPLTAADYASLELRWIDKPCAEALGVRRVDSVTGSRLMGRRAAAHYEGLAIPYVLPGESRIREWRLRRDRPDIEFKKGKQKERNKYLSPPGRGNMIYFVPGIAAELLTVVSIPVIITEGEFKTQALWRLANYESTRPRFLPIGLGGAWNWRGTVGKTNGPGGERLDVKGVIADFNRLTWAGRRVIIAFDADATDNGQVEVSKKLLAQELRQRGAEVASVTWDISLGKGIDDLLANIGPEKVLALLDNADFQKKEDEVNISVDRIASAITDKHHFARDAGGRLHVFRGGTYHSSGELFIREQVKQILKGMRLASKWTSHRAEEVIKFIEVDVRLLWERPSLDIINVLNGLLDVKTRKLLPHSPEFLSPVQIPVNFDPHAQCPKWEKFVAEVFPADAEAIAWEVLAWLMMPDTSIQKAILLVGDGANGKSTFLRGVLAFLGKQNTAALSLHKLETDRFAAARLTGKLANVCSDLPSTDLTSTSIFKAITGGDTIPAEHKFQNSFELVPYARLVFSTNHLPKSQDASPAFFRRWLVVPFEQIFSDGATNTIPSDKLDAMLADPEELSGVLNKALDALPAITGRGFSQSESLSRAADEFRKATDPFAAWLDRNTVLRPDGVTPQDQLYSQYALACDHAGRPATTKTAVGIAMKKLRTTVTNYQRTVNGCRCWCYIGISLVAGDRS